MLSKSATQDVHHGMFIYELKQWHFCASEWALAVKVLILGTADCFINIAKAKNKLVSEVCYLVFLVSICHFSYIFMNN